MSTLPVCECAHPVSKLTQTSPRIPPAGPTLIPWHTQYYSFASKAPLVLGSRPPVGWHGWDRGWGSNHVASSSLVGGSLWQGTTSWVTLWVLFLLDFKCCFCSDFDWRSAWSAGLASRNSGMSAKVLSWQIAPDELNQIGVMCRASILMYFT